MAVKREEIVASAASIEPPWWFGAVV